MTVTAASADVLKKKRRRKRVKRLIVTLVLLCLLGLGGYIGYQKLRADYRITYDSYTATTGTISNSLSFSGTMQLKDSATYTASADTSVREVYVAVGQRVQKDDRLIRLKNGDLITADFDATVNKVEVAKGDDVKAGDTLLQIADFDHMQVNVRVGESNIAAVSVGQSCRVAVASINANFESAISTIDHASYTGNNVAYYATTVDVDTSGVENIYPGMQATVTVPRDEANNVVILKMDAITTNRENNAFVYKQAEDGTMTLSPVTVGVSNGNYVEIKEGVASGETVYAVAKKDETATGLSALFSNAFGSQRVNPPMGQGPGNWNRNNGNGTYNGTPRNRGN